MSGSAVDRWHTVSELPGRHPAHTCDRQERVYFILISMAWREAGRVKIGYTGHLKQRLKHHASYGAGGDVIGSLPGTRRDEAAWHQLATDLTSGSGYGEIFRLTAQLDYAITRAIKMAGFR